MPQVSLNFFVRQRERWRSSIRFALGRWWRAVLDVGLGLHILNCLELDGRFALYAFSGRGRRIGSVVAIIAVRTMIAALGHGCSRRSAGSWHCPLGREVYELVECCLAPRCRWYNHIDATWRHMQTRKAITGSTRSARQLERNDVISLSCRSVAESKVTFPSCTGQVRQLQAGVDRFI